MADEEYERRMVYAGEPEQPVQQQQPPGQKEEKKERRMADWLLVVVAAVGSSLVMMTMVIIASAATRMPASSGVSSDGCDLTAMTTSWGRGYRGQRRVK